MNYDWNVQKARQIRDRVTSQSRAEPELAYVSEAHLQGYRTAVKQVISLIDSLSKQQEDLRTLDLAIRHDTDYDLWNTLVE